MKKKKKNCLPVDYKEILKSTPSLAKKIARSKNNAGLMESYKYSRKKKHKNEEDSLSSST